MNKLWSIRTEGISNDKSSLIMGLCDNNECRGFINIVLDCSRSEAFRRGEAIISLLGGQNVLKPTQTASNEAWAVDAAREITETTKLCWSPEEWDEKDAHETLTKIILNHAPKSNESYDTAG